MVNVAQFVALYNIIILHNAIYARSCEFYLELEQSEKEDALPVYFSVS